MIFYRKSKLICIAKILALVTLTGTLFFLAFSPDTRRSTKGFPSQTAISHTRKDKKLDIQLTYEVTDTSRLHLYIFEEHEEAILYWFRWRDNKLLPNHTIPNLVHIDGHSDSAPLVFQGGGIPLKRYLTKIEQIKRLIASNDEFIMAGQFTGLIANSTWIMPFWEAERYNKTPKFQIRQSWQTKGVAKVNGRLMECICFENSTTCISAERDDTEFIFLKKYCYYRRGPFFETEMSEVHAEEQIKYMKQKPYILDIDEDFFGVHLVGNHLIKYNINESLVDMISAILGETICLTKANQEMTVDKWFVGILDYILAKCKHMCNTGSMSSNIVQSIPSHMICANKTREQLFRKISSLVFILRKLPAGAIKALQYTGLCLKLSPYVWERPSTYHYVKLCTGGNFPGNSSSAVLEHIANEKELDQQLNRIENILQALMVSNGPPIMITLCRSGRDGYVPRHQQQYIERRLTHMIKRIFHISDSRIHYDQYLYAGIHGIHFHKKQQLAGKRRDYSQYF